MTLNVLVVDDSAVMRKTVIRCLQMAGLSLGGVHEAENGQAALECVDKHWIDLALVDINMPVMNGEELIKRFRSDAATEDLPVIVISTEGSRPRIERLEAQGVRFVHKPFTPEVLREALQSVEGFAHGAL
jgi:two-component system chemotaxis response regulator CheY